jgi:phosphoglycolate phosphatase
VKCILFDLDGTLVDPLQAIGGSVCYALEKMGRPVPALASLGWLIGPPLQSSLATLLDSEDADEAAQCLAFYRERFSTVGLTENTVYAGIREMLEAAKTAGLRMFVATSKPVVYAVRILEHAGLEEFFDSIYGSELDGTRVNKADVLAYLLETEHLAAADCLMIGDREHDILGASSNDIPAIGVLWGYGSEQELTSAGATAVCSSPGELMTALGL